jgi:hypothetical protein
MNSLYSYIKESRARAREYSIYGFLPVVIKDKLESEEADLGQFVEEIEKRVPQHLLQNVEIIYIGNFPILDGRNALYADEAIYITNEEPTTHDLLEDAIHEIAHSLESTFAPLIYGTGALEAEFLGKRERLKTILDAHGYEFPEKNYLDPVYSEVFDEFLGDVIGYPTLLNLTMGLFASPYAATSLREYFANGFEKYYLEAGSVVKQVSPVLYNILNTLYKESDNI